MSWDACTFEPNAVLQWMECHPGVSSWVQAGGVILTVAGALLGPPIKASFDRSKIRRFRRRESDAMARRCKGDAELLLSRIDGRLAQLREAPAAADHTVTRDRFGIEIPGAIDPLLMQNGTALDRARIAFLFDFVEDVRTYNNRLFARPVGPGEDDPDAFRQYLLGQLANLQAQGRAVLETIRRRS